MTRIASSEQFWDGFLSSFTLILASELGDKTFLTTSIFCLEYPRLVVFLSSMFALTTMNILSILLAMLTTTIPAIIIHYISVTLFFVFGIKMIYEGFLTSKEEKIDEVEKLITDKTKKPKAFFSDNIFVFIKIFSMIFLTEWGDKSQLSTIILGAKKGFWAVGLGSFFGNFISTIIAVLSSRIISHIISVESVQIIGGIVFVGCSIFQLYSEPK